ncbi:DUF1656 domain-containing protein [Methylobacterium gnaphalii]|uniref:DUF1656 domain-containing protein n=1 Tax=Methylobacterium gnaphalii TaxID=1010610 RepID=A0A512JR72_9HYPH|nr:DUF1656 domain-containing protein [Methylobacterium gnaphalii]GEP12383.1 DUF1656 domain-containing protein [Methylobacterium gnaphalii]GJD69868.1 Protein AaeX [Methylobacterium gnaphalii]
MTSELDIYGVFIPSLAAWMLIAFLVCVALSRLLTFTGFYRFVWHRPLFDLALYIVVLGAVVSVGLPLTP